MLKKQTVKYQNYLQLDARLLYTILYNIYFHAYYVLVTFITSDFCNRVRSVIVSERRDNVIIIKQIISHMTLK